MADPIAPSLISRLTSRRRRTVRAPEPADLGTAFGMERWLDDIENAAVAPAPAPAAPRATGWRNRWLSRQPKG
jgi:hypothetical protein